MTGGVIDVEIEVSVRKYPIDTKRLASVLAEHKRNAKLSNNQIAELLNKPRTMVEHWFRQDRYFAIPDEDVWFPLKELLRIKTDEFDKAVMTFEQMGGGYDMRNRIYYGDISPTLTVNSGSYLYLIEK